MSLRSSRPSILMDGACRTPPRRDAISAAQSPYWIFTKLIPGVAKIGPHRSMAEKYFARLAPIIMDRQQMPTFLPEQGRETGFEFGDAVWDQVRRNALCGNLAMSSR